MSCSNIKNKCLSFDFDDTDLFKLSIEIRTEVFVREQNVPEDLEYDGLDDKSKHFLLFIDQKAVATSRLRKTNRGYKLERFAVLKDYRKQNYGSYLLEYILNYVDDKTKVYFNSQISSVKFYEKNGFKTLGKSFYEAGIEHYEMIYAGS